MHTVEFFGAQLFATRKPAGFTELPESFAAMKGQQVIIVGDPPPDAIQLAFSLLGFERGNVNRYPAGEGIAAFKGLFVNSLA